MSGETKIEKQSRKTKNPKRKKSFAGKITIIVLVAIVVIAAAIFLISAFTEFTGYEVISTLDIPNADANIKVEKYKSGYVKCAGDGLTYFDRNNIYWTETYTMAQPLCDVSGDYVAVCDVKSTEVFLYNASGYLNTISVPNAITDVEVSKLGTIAVATKDGNTNYILVYDSDGNELINAKTVFSSSGYPVDISLSSDGERLAAAFVGTKGTSINSKVVFYDFSKNADSGEDLITGTFDDFKGTLLTTVEFVNDSKVVACGDNAIVVYDAEGTPSVANEMRDFSYQIQSLFLDSGHVGMVVENKDGEDAYCVKVYNLDLKTVLDQPFDYAYNKVGFAGDSVYIYSDYDVDIYNYFGTHKLSETFDTKIINLASCGDGSAFIYMTSQDTQFIQMK